MRGRVEVRRWLMCSAVVFVPGVGGALAQKAKVACRRAVVEGEVSAGQGIERGLGNGLKMMFEPLAAGWVLRVVPAVGARGEHDYAELATPPYASVSPLLVSTDFSFRAQDAVAWNPRRFHWAASAAEYAKLAAAYGELRRTVEPSAKVQEAVAELAAAAPDGEIKIVDARLVPGTADQVPQAAMVATHFATTAHTVEQPKDGKASALGRVSWMRFRVGFDLPAGFRTEAGVKTEVRRCP